MKYWLLKTEPDTFSYDDLVRAGVEPWTGVRNYQARNFLREMKPGDLCVFYHSNAKPTGAVGVCRVVREVYDDPTSPEPGRWSAVDVAAAERFARVVTLAELQGLPELTNSPLVRRGNRLSVLPLSPDAFEAIRRAAALQVLDLQALD